MNKSLDEDPKQRVRQLVSAQVLVKRLKFTNLKGYVARDSFHEDKIPEPGPEKRSGANQTSENADRSSTRIRLDRC
jgi:hypothetical protein